MEALVKSSRIRSSAFILGFVAAVLPGSAARRADACGDKFVRVGRGGRFQRGYVAVHPSSILVFVDAGSAGAPSMQKLPATLKAAGHKAQVVGSPIAFAEALLAHRYDLVMAEAEDLPRLAAAMEGAVPRPQVLGVQRAEKKYQVLVDIDATMAASRK